MQVVIPFQASWIGRQRGPLLWAEYALLLAGLAALDYYIWVNASAELSQAYENWSFSQELQGQQVTFGRFIQYEVQRLLGKETRTAAPTTPIPLSVPRAIEQAPKQLPAPPRLAESSVVGRMEIPRLGLNLMIREGVTSKTLRSAVGHVRSTALPGYPGNVALAAHRDSFFRPLRNIKQGDFITVATLNGTYKYAVDSIQIVPPTAVGVLKPSAAPMLTLITCYPFYYVGSAPQRFIVQARQVPAVERNSVR